MKVSKAKANGIKTMTCSKTGEVLPLSEFRVHAKGYYLSYSKGWERAEAKRRRTAKAGNTTTGETAVVTITTSTGKTFEAHTAPIIGGRKGESEKTDIVLYFKESVTRDQVRSAFRAHTGVPMTGIKAGKVTA